MRKLTAVSDLDLGKRGRGSTEQRVRRDPRRLLELLLSPLLG
jgi:hypothetical protein